MMMCVFGGECEGKADHVHVNVVFLGVGECDEKS